MYVCVYIHKCVYKCVVRIRRGGEAVHLAARRGRMESWRTAAGGYGVKAVGARLVEGGRGGEGGKMGVFGWPNRGGSGRRGGVGPRGGRGVAVARPGSRRLLTRPVAQLDSTRLSARWQEAAAESERRRKSSEGEKALARGGGESVGAGEEEEEDEEEEDEEKDGG